MGHLLRMGIPYRFHYTSKTLGRKCPPSPSTILFGTIDENNPPDLPSRKSPSSTKFERLIDDFIGKRFGAGEAFYGKRTSSLSEEEYQEMLSGTESRRKSLDEYERQPMGNDAILVVGDNESDDVLLWIALELLEKGFTVRIACTALSKAVEQFGLPGLNVDMIELSERSKPDKFERALRGVQAMVFCVNLDPCSDAPWGGAVRRTHRARAAVAERLLALANSTRLFRSASPAANLDVQKVVCVSRALPPGMNGAEPNEVPSIANSIRSATEEALSYFRYLKNGPGVGVNAAESRFDSFRWRQEYWEQQVRESGIEYMIVRAPPIVQRSVQISCISLFSRVVHYLTDEIDHCTMESHEITFSNSVPIVCLNTLN